MYFHYFVIFPLGKGQGPAFEQIWIPVTQVQIGPVVLEKKIFLNFVNVYSLYRNFLPLEKGRALHLKKLESPSSKDALFQVWLKLAQWIWRRWTMWKDYDNDDGIDNDDGQRTNFDQKISLEPSAQVS